MAGWIGNGPHDADQRPGDPRLEGQLGDDAALLAEVARDQLVELRGMLGDK